MRRLGWFAAWPAGLALGVATAVIARSDPAYAFAGSGVQIAVELLAGYALIASGLIWIRGRQPGTVGVLFVAGGCGWFLLEWNNPGVGAPLVFTVGLVLYASAPPLLAHALLTVPGPALRVARRAVIATAYAGSLLALGLLPALVYDPGAQGCSQCPRNLLLVHGSPVLYRQFNRVGVYVGLVWTVLTLALLAGRLARSSFAARRRLIPVLIPGCAYVAIVAADFAASVQRGYLSNDSVDRWLWLGEAVALTLVALAPAWSWVRARRTRARLARLVVDLSSAPSPGGLEAALARSLGDPGVRIAYPIVTGRYVDAGGRPVASGADVRRRSSATASRSRSSAISLVYWMIPVWSRTSPQPRASPSTTSGCARSCWLTWPNSGAREDGSSPPETKSADGSSATFTMARSSGSSG